MEEIDIVLQIFSFLNFLGGGQLFLLLFTFAISYFTCCFKCCLGCCIEEPRGLFERIYIAHFHVTPVCRISPIYLCTAVISTTNSDCDSLHALLVDCRSCYFCWQQPSLWKWMCSSLKVSICFRIHYCRSYSSTLSFSKTFFILWFPNVINCPVQLLA